MTDHSPAFASALAAVSALLGAPSRVERLTRWSLATWERGPDLCELDDGEDRVVLSAANRDDAVRTWDVGDDPAEAVCAACEHLSWPLPRPALPGLAPRPFDRDGAPRSTTGGPMGEADW